MDFKGNRLYPNQIDLKTQELNAIKKRQTRTIVNNILEDESVKTHEKSSFFPKFSISQIYSISIVYGTLFIKLALMVTQLVYRNVFMFLFKREKPVVDENVLITGSGGYLGQNLAMQFAKRGATLILLDSNEEANQQTYNNLKSNGYNKVHTFTVDLGDEVQLKNTTNLVKKQIGFVSVVLMTAAPKIVPKSVLDLDFNKDIENNFRVNYLSQLWLIQEFLQSMINRNNGHFVTFSSSTAAMDFPLISVYASMKSAQTKLIESVREELRVNRISNVHASVVYLGMLNTGLFKGIDSCFDTNEYLKSSNIMEIAESITSSILMNKCTIFAPALIRTLFLVKYLVSPQIVAFLVEYMTRIKENGLKLKPKIF